MFSFYYVYKAATLFLYPMKDYITEYGCYVVDFLDFYGVVLVLSVSFFPLFRYICLVQERLLLKFGLCAKVRLLLNW